MRYVEMGMETASGADGADGAEVLDEGRMGADFGALTDEERGGATADEDAASGVSEGSDGIADTEADHFDDADVDSSMEADDTDASADEDSFADDDTGDASDVRADADDPADSDPDPDAAAFEDAMLGKHRDRLARMLTDVIAREADQRRDAELENARLRRVARTLANRWGVPEGDLDALETEAALTDPRLQEEAARRGMPVDSLRALRRTELENARLREDAVARARSDAAMARYGAWLRQAEAARSVYPSIDLRKESENPVFTKLLRAGMHVRAAYEACHPEALARRGGDSAGGGAANGAGIGGANSAGISANGAGIGGTNSGPNAFADAAAARRAAREANARRPLENALSGGVTGVMGLDAERMTRADRARILRRVERGERVEL